MTMAMKVVVSIVQAVLLLFAQNLKLADADANTASVVVQIESDPTGGCPGAVFVDALRLDREATSTLSDRRAAPVVSGAARLRLSPGLWSLEARADGCWSSSRQVSVGQEDAAPSVILHLFRAGRLEGRLQLAAPALAPAKLEVAFQPPTLSMSSRDDARSGRVVCPVRDQQFECVLPAGTLDLRFRRQGYVPVYAWDVTIASGSATRLPVTLTTGASLVGWVEDAEGAPAPGTRVSLLGATGEPIKPSANAPSVAATTTARGFFQFIGVPPIECQVQASREGGASDTVSVRLDEDAETALKGPLTLMAPSRLEVLVDPPSDQGQPWRLDILVEAQPGSSRLMPVRQDIRVPVDGRWSAEALPLLTRLHVFMVRRSSGEPWHASNVELRPPNPDPVHLHVPSLRLSGVVKVGDKPVKGGSLLIGSPVLSTRVPLPIEEDGTFSGSVPLEQRSELVLDVQVSSSSPPIRRSFNGIRVDGQPASGEVWIELRLPETILRGEVVTASGRPSAAMITLQRSSPGEVELVQFMVDEGSKGRFQLEGLAAGEFLVRAGADGAQSDDARVALSEDRSGDVRLVLREQSEIRGQVDTPEGLPVPGAFVSVEPFQGTAAGFQATTDAAGRLRGKVSPGTQDLGITVGASGFAYRITRARVATDRTFRVTVPRDGGRLHLHFRPQTMGGMAVGAMLYHEGFRRNVFQLAWWAAARGGKSTAYELVLPDVAAGAYKFCAPPTLPVPTGRTVPDELCVEGTLPVGGELTLDVSNVSAAATNTP